MKTLVALFLAAGLVVNITGGGKVIRLLPSVMLSESQVKMIVETIRDVVSTL
jgi:4-aminobutyrate aminotransferase-like enzyme